MTPKKPEQGQLMLTIDQNTSVIFGDDQMRLTYLGRSGKLMNFIVVSPMPLNGTAINLGGKYATTIQVPVNQVFDLTNIISFFVSRPATDGRKVMVGVRAPREVSVHREKVFQRIKETA